LESESYDYYQILQVPRHATLQRIKQSYRRLARQYHPDLNQGNPEAEEKIKQVIEAFETLSDKEKRRAYDALFFDKEVAGRRKISVKTNFSFLSTKQIFLVLTVIGILVSGFSVFTYVSNLGKPAGEIARKMKEVEEMLHTQLQTNAEKSQVISLMESHKVIKWYESEQLLPWFEGNLSPSQKASITNYTLYRIPDQREVKVVEDIVVIFCFDKNERLVNAWVRRESNSKKDVKVPDVWPY
jgi:curved DNA-binding protein CbpA